MGMTLQKKLSLIEGLSSDAIKEETINKQFAAILNVSR